VYENQKPVNQEKTWT